MTADEQREARIKEYIQNLIKAKTLSERHKWWCMARDEIIDRSPEQVRKMEKERGLEVV